MGNVMSATAVADMKGLYLARFEQSADGADWFSPIRQAAMKRFMELGFPTTKHEEWRFTNVASVANTAYEPATKAGDQVLLADIKPYLLKDELRLVFVNGELSEPLSSLDDLPDGLQISNLVKSMQSHRSMIECHLGVHASFEDEAFVALNTALFDEGALIHIAADCVVEKPIHVVFLTLPNQTPTVIFPRMLVVAEANSQVSLIESYVGLQSGSYFNCSVTEVSAGENAVVDHYRLIREGDRASHMGTYQVHQDRSSQVSAMTMTMSGQLVRNNLGTVLDGEGAHGELNGLYVTHGDQHVDNHLSVDHAKPHCDSREYFKGILDDKSRGVFSGRIMVRVDAQQTDAKQTNKSLLLSRDAQVESKPQLEIFADDVKCTHGATIGQVSDEAVFYLRSRGISESAAKSLLVFAFAKEVIDMVKIPTLKNHLEAELFRRLPHAELFTEIV